MLARYRQRETGTGLGNALKRGIWRPADPEASPMRLALSDSQPHTVKDAARHIPPYQRGSSRCSQATAAKKVCTVLFKNWPTD
jgi:hypothetical protein